MKKIHDLTQVFKIGDTICEIYERREGEGWCLSTKLQCKMLRFSRADLCNQNIAEQISSCASNTLMGKKMFGYSFQLRKVDEIVFTGLSMGERLAD